MSTQLNMRDSSKAKRENCELLYSVVAEGHKTSAAIFKRAQEKGIGMKIKNIFPYLEFLRDVGRIISVPNTRPRQWLAVSDSPKEVFNPVNEYEQPLLILMGYTKVQPTAGKKISPLQLYEDHGHSRFPKNGRKPVYGIQSAFRGSIYQI